MEGDGADRGTESGEKEYEITEMERAFRHSSDTVHAQSSAFMERPQGPVSPHGIALRVHAIERRTIQLYHNNEAIRDNLRVYRERTVEKNNMLRDMIVINGILFEDLQATYQKQKKVVYVLATVSCITLYALYRMIV